MGTVLTGWYVGYVVAAVVIVVVVGLVGWLLALARRIGVQAAAIVDALADIRGTTAPVPLVGKLNQKLLHVVQQASTARVALLGEDQG
ncbi:MAG: hypothetical protein M3256_24950 [Actinomycetota bacterium]|nr:hypothetical protein [Actinomycetota bacterium]